MKGFHSNVENDTIKNNDFRHVIYTGPNAQLVLMSLKKGEEIGLEIHKNLDQFIRVEEGTGKAVIGNENYTLKAGDAIVVPAGSKHNVIATSELKLYTIYTSNQHPDGIIEKTKEDADNREKSSKKNDDIKEDCQKYFEY